MATTNLTQITQTPHPQCVVEVIQNLIEETREFKSKSKLVIPFFGDEGVYLVYHVDEGLSILPGETPDRLNLIPV